MKIGGLSGLLFLNMGSIFTVLGLINSIIIITGSVIGSIIPDLDHPKSKMNQYMLGLNQKYFKTIVFSSLGLVFCFYGNGTSRFIIGGYLILTGASNHRGFTHSIIGMLWFSLICKIVFLNYGISPNNILKEALELKDIFVISKFFNYNFAKGFLIGYISHLAADFLTNAGIEVLWPNKRNYKLEMFDERNVEVLYWILAVWGSVRVLFYLI